MRLIVSRTVPANGGDATVSPKGRARRRTWRWTLFLVPVAVALVMSPLALMVRPGVPGDGAGWAYAPAARPAIAAAAARAEAIAEAADRPYRVDGVLVASWSAGPTVVSADAADVALFAPGSADELGTPIAARLAMTETIEPVDRSYAAPLGAGATDLTIAAGAPPPAAGTAGSSVAIPRPVVRLASIGSPTRSGAVAPSTGGGGAGWNYAIASWYGPGFYGNRTACGQTYTDSIIGFAHRTLPCGTAVTFMYGGRVVTARVIDRGPYIAGRTFDLSAALCRALAHCWTGGIYYR